MKFPSVEHFAPLNDGLTGISLVGGCTVYIPYSHETDVDTLHDKLNSFDQWQRKNIEEVSKETLEAINGFLEDTEESFVTDEFEMADIVYEWLEKNHPEK